MTSKSNWDGHTWDDAGRVRHIGRCSCCGRVRRLAVVILDQSQPGGRRVCGDCAAVAIWAAVQEAVFSGPVVRVVPIRKAVA